MVLTDIPGKAFYKISMPAVCVCHGLWRDLRYTRMTVRHSTY